MLKGTNPYIRDGYLYFDKISFTKCEVSFYHKGRRLCTYRLPHEVRFECGEMFTLDLSPKGNRVKIEIDI